MLAPAAWANEMDQAPVLQELVVTSTKQPRELEELTGSVTLKGERWLERHIPLSVSRLAAHTPGLSTVNSGGRNPTALVMRGMRVASVQANDLEGDGGTVARYIDNIPLQGSFLPPDLPWIDLTRVEVMKGPQSILYGSDSLAGLVRYVTTKPDPDKPGGSLALTASDTAHSDSLGGSATLVANLPLAEGKAASRLALGADHEAGFIDNDVLLSGPARDINAASGEQGRLSFLWAPHERLKAQASVHYHQRRVEDRQATNAAFTGDPYKASSRYLQPSDTSLGLANLTLEYQWQWAQLTLIHSHYDYETQRQADQTDFLLTLDERSGSSFYSTYEDFSALTLSDFKVSKTASEVRLSSPLEAKQWLWLLGATHSRDRVDGEVTDEVPGFSEFFGVAESLPDYRARQRERLSERALYAESSYRLNEAWQVTVGGRYYRQSDDLGQCSMLPLIERLSGNNDPAFLCNDDEAHDSGFLWKLSGRYRASFGGHWYGAFSEGIRRGGSNALPTDIDHHRFYGPDRVDHYEVGFRSGSLWQKASLSAALYYVDWTDIQISTWIPEGYPVLANAGGARIAGVEVEGRMALGSHWGLAMGASYSDGELREPVSELVAGEASARRGDRLPGSPRRQWHLTLDSQHRFDAVEVDTLVSLTSMGEVTTALNPAFVRYQRLPAHTSVAVHLGMTVDAWRWTLAVDNLLDERAVIGVRHPRDYGASGRFENITRPRTVTVGARIRF
ncbi:TonB-dependent receptor [Marinimicrobium locisalis]|uniref:TonB-dependent receptor n=1 Tax=Marinimicrobium locisalis TaxID=546022 RepID=UPI003221F1F1